MVVNTRTQDKGSKRDIESSSARPRALAVIAGNIPASLKARRQWVCWEYFWEVKKDGSGKWTKIPLKAYTPEKLPNGRRSTKKASTTVPATWREFDEALQWHLDHPDTTDGIGYVFCDDDPYTGVDLDDALDPATHQLKTWGKDFLDRLNSYSEVSPSDTGLKTWAEGKKKGDLCKKPFADGEVEMYDTGRYFCVTGHSWHPEPLPIREAQAALDHVYDAVFGASKKASPAPKTPERNGTDSGAFVMKMKPDPATSDEAMLECARTAKNGAKFSRLWDGDVSGYASKSEADAALVSLLCFWSEKDRLRIDRLFRQSKLFDDKWDAKRGKTTYGWYTIDKMIPLCTETYGSGRNGKATHRSASGDGSKGPPADPGTEQAGRKGWEIIRDYFDDSNDPTFKRGTTIFSRKLGREVKASEATYGASEELLKLLATAIDVPRWQGGAIKEEALPRFFATWARTAWVELLKDLEEEEDTGEITDAAQEDFRSRVTHLLQALVTLGETCTETRVMGGREETRDVTHTQRRPLIRWAERFAKIGKWADVRGLQIWSRTVAQKDEPPYLDVALRLALASQVPGFSDLLQLGEKRFAALALKYEIGLTGDDARVQGRRVVRLLTPFVKELLSCPEDAPEEGPEVADTVAVDAGDLAIRQD